MRILRRSMALWVLALAATMYAGAQSPVDAPSSGTDLTQERAMIDRGQAADALKKLDAMASQSQPSASIDRGRGLALYALGRYQEADAAFAAALKRDARDQEAAQMRGLTLYRLGKPTEAIQLLESARGWTGEAKVDPSYVLALCYIDTHRYDDARHAFAMQYGFERDSAAAYLLTARILFRREYVSAAQDFARTAIALEPQLPLAHSLLGEAALAGGHLEEAIAEFEKERTRNPLEGSVYDRLGDAYSRAGDNTKAQQALQRALVLEPNATAPYILLGKVLLAKQDPAGAAMYLERAEAMDPGNAITHNLLARAYRLVGRTEDANRESQLARKLQAADEPKLETLH